MLCKPAGISGSTIGTTGLCGAGLDCGVERATLAAGEDAEVGADVVADEGASAWLFCEFIVIF